MHLTRCLLLAPILFASPALAGTPAEAARIRQGLKDETEHWEAELKAAPPDAVSQRKVWEKRPDVKAACASMWACLRPSLAEDWTIEYDAWLLRAYPSIAGGPTPGLAEAITTMRKSIEQQHLRSPKLAPICLALATSQDPMALSILEKVEAQNPDPKVQGVAALGQSMLLKGFGDDGDQMAKRLALIRKAIINSADVSIDGVPVSKMAEDELYVIRFLTKGRVAPDLEGLTSGGQGLKLSSYAGKTVVLLFWGSNIQDLDHLLEAAATMQKKYAGKPFALIGVNNDPTLTLRQLETKPENPLTWRNFSDPTNKLGLQYRIGLRPLAFVLDGQRTIRYIGPPGSFLDLTVDAVLEEPPAPAPVRPADGDKDLQDR